MSNSVDGDHGSHISELNQVKFQLVQEDSTKYRTVLVLEIKITTKSELNQHFQLVCEDSSLGF